ncbi:lipocalin-like domain-containing protein [Polymorphobacter arshaanensis]|nr:lipocalin-like domain-containing protein [Polymorphobacter arshaanensis]
MLIALLLAGGAHATPAEEAAKAAAIGLAGSWQLVRFENTDAKGKVEKPFGEHPRGLFVYDNTGHLSINITRNPATPPFAKGDDAGTDAEVRAAYDGYVAYFGTYRVDTANNAVIHVVEGSLKPSYTGTDQPRPFKLTGDVLIIGKTNTDGSKTYRELHRLR